MRKYRYYNIHNSYGAREVTFGDESILIESVEGIGAPDFFPQEQKAPYQDGATYIGGLYNSRNLILQCAFRVDTLTDINTQKAALTKYLSAHALGFDTTTRTQKLARLYYAPDGVTETYSIECVPVGSPVYPNKNYADGWQRFQVTFYCPRAFWETAETEATASVVDQNTDESSYEKAVYAKEIKSYVAVSNISRKKRIEQSYDGITWTAIEQDPVAGGSTYPAYNGCAWSPSLSLFVIVGPPHAADTYPIIKTSPDGVTWTKRVNTLTMTSLREVIWAEEFGFFLAVGSGTGNLIAKSTDGVTWSEVTSDWNNDLYTVCYSRELRRFIVGGTYSAVTTSYIMQSESAESGTWNIRAWSGSVTQVNQIVWSRQLKLFCGVGVLTGVPDAAVINTSPDGVTWTARTSSTSAGSGNLKDLIWSESLELFIATGQGYTDVGLTNPMRVETSSNGTTWTANTQITAGATKLVPLEADNKIILLAGQTGQPIYYSIDGLDYYTAATDDFKILISNSGDVPIGVILDIPVKGSAGASDELVISLDTLWDGTGTIDSENIMRISTYGLSTGSVIIDTRFGEKTVKQFDESVIAKFTDGNFFSVPPGTHYIYIHDTQSTGERFGLPTATYRTRKLGV